MPAARRRLNLEQVVDDLVIRLRFILPPIGNVARTHPLFGLGDEPHLASIFREARIWWLTNELGQLDADGRRSLIDEVLERNADEAILASVGLFGSASFPELTEDDVERMQAWYELPRPPPRAIRDALALRVLTVWFIAKPSQIVTEKLESWLLSTTAGLLRAALVVSVGLAHQSSSRHGSLLVRALNCIPVILNLGESDVDSAAGWLLSSVWPIEPSLIEDWLHAHGALLSRKVFRIAVGRMPTHVRSQLTTAWKAQRQRQRLNAAKGKSTC